MYLLLVLFALYYIAPLYVMLSTSFKSLDEIRHGNLLALPHTWNTVSWGKAWSSA
ncbi:MAG TPA: sugar ABC transporter permease, partial [Oxalobacteraceae bacterium]|nr:sugar ABC transporter permease [Oxalobacteraceae bacterium]